MPFWLTHPPSTILSKLKNNSEDVSIFCGTGARHADQKFDELADITMETPDGQKILSSGAVELRFSSAIWHGFNLYKIKEAYTLKNVQ